MTTAAATIATAARYDGTVESPPLSNRQPFAAIAHHANGYAWCATFLVAVANLAHLGLPPGADSAYTPTMEAAFKRAGRLSTTPHVGAFAFLYFPSLGRVAHCGLVTAVDGSDVLTIEGNTNTDGGRDGYLVARHRRPAHRSTSAAGIRSYGLPAYTTPTHTRPTLGRYLRAGSTGAAVVQLQRELNRRAYRLATDGVFGAHTKAAVVAWQRDHRITADGVIGPQSCAELGWRWTG